jgi:hypothetical protein
LEQFSDIEIFNIGHSRLIASFNVLCLGTDSLSGSVSESICSWLVNELNLRFKIFEVLRDVRCSGIEKFFRVLSDLVIVVKVKAREIHKVESVVILVQIPKIVFPVDVVELKACSYLLVSDDKVPSVERGFQFLDFV